MRYVFGIIALLGVAGCSPLRYSMVAPIESIDNHYEEADFAVDFEFTDRHLVVHVTNKTEELLEVRWNSAYFTGSSGRRQPVWFAFRSDGSKHERRREPRFLGRYERESVVVLPEECVPRDGDLIPLSEFDVERGGTIGLALPIGLKEQSEDRIEYVFNVD